MAPLGTMHGASWLHWVLPPQVGVVEPSPPFPSQTTSQECLYFHNGSKRDQPHHTVGPPD